MNHAELTDRLCLATSLPMQERNRVKPGRSRKVAQAALVLVGGSMGLGGCVSVNAPDKPIVIELNINIKQEVIYRLAEDAGNTIDKNPEIF
jgi:hypothetical protein